VGLTRARQRAIVSYAANRRIHNQWQSALPSRFLSELPQQHLAADNPAGLHGGATGAGGGWGRGMGEGPAQGPAWTPAQRNAHWGPTWTSRGRDTGPGGNYGRGRGGGVGRGGLVIEGRATELKRTTTSKFAVGARVFHQKFGYGKVIAVEADRLEIDFEKAGTKKVIDSFVEPVS